MSNLLRIKKEDGTIIPYDIEARFVNANCIELYNDGPYIDFHYGSDGSDFTTRIIEQEKGVLTVWGSMIISSRLQSNDWFRSVNATGWYNETYGGGIWMNDPNNVRVYGGKQFVCDSYIHSSRCIIYDVPYGDGQGFAISGSNADASGYVTQIKYCNNSQPYIEIATPNQSTAKKWGVNIWASDIKLKENIKELSSRGLTYRSATSENSINALDIVKSIKHYSFDWKDKSGHVNIGYIADYLKEVYPDAVFEVGEDDMKTKHINHTTLIPLITMAMQEQNDIIEKQNKKISDLENRLLKIEELLASSGISSNEETR